MTNSALRRRAGIAFAVVCLGVLLLLPAPAIAGRPPALGVDDGGYGPNDRPVFFLVSLEDVLVTPYINKVNGKVMNSADDMGSRLLVANVGTYVAGFEIEDTRFEGAGLSHIDLDNLPPPVGGEVPIMGEDLDQNAVTVVGSFCTFTEQIHMVTPVPDPIPAAVQEAFFNASGIIDQLLFETPHPTTVELACFIHEHQGDAGADVNEIMEHLFASNMTLTCTTCFAEGDLFPHDPTEEGLFNFDVKFDADDGTFSLNICLPVEFWIKGQNDNNPFNLGSNGVLPVVVPTTEHFNAVTEVDVDTLQIGWMIINPLTDLLEFDGVPIVKYAYEDQDGDGDIDLVVHFDTQEIVGLGIDENTTSLDFFGYTNLGMCMEGNDSIRIVPPTK